MGCRSGLWEVATSGRYLGGQLEIGGTKNDWDRGGGRSRTMSDVLWCHVVDRVNIVLTRGRGRRLNRPSSPLSTNKTEATHPSPT